MARKKRSVATQKLELPDSPFFKLPGELRNCIYELVFVNDSETIDVADAFFPPTKIDAAPPSSALLRSCRVLLQESQRIFAVAYHEYWRKSFLIDLKCIDNRFPGLDCVPTVWIDTYIFRYKSRAHPRRVRDLIMSRSDGTWYGTTESEEPPGVVHTCSEAFDRLVVIRGCSCDECTAIHTCPYSKERPSVDVGRENSATVKPKKKNNKLFSRRSNKSTQKPKPKYKRPTRPATRKTVCHKLFPDPGPLNRSTRELIVRSRWLLPRDTRPLTPGELRFILRYVRFIDG